jgi:hypothetical protein
MFRSVLFLLAFAVVLAGIVSARAADAVDPRLAGYPELRFQLTEERIEAPDQIAAGRTLLIEEVEGEHAGHAFMFRVPDEVSDEELEAVLAADASAAEETPAWFYQAWFVGNGDRALPGRPAMAVVDLQPGRYVIGDPFRAPTEYARLDVVAQAESYDLDTALAPDVSIDLFEMDFTIPDDLVAGSQVWEVKNSGAMLHEIAIVPVPSGVSKQAVVDAIIAVGDVAFFGAERTPERLAALHGLGFEWMGWDLELAGGVGVLSPQAVSFAQLDLAEGTYAAICFIPGPDGTPHFITGMTTVFTVAPAAN